MWRATGAPNGTGDSGHRAPRLSPLGGPLQRVDVELLHLQHRRHGALGLFGVRARQQLAQDRGNHLPRNPEAVLEPAALDFLTTRRELVPEMIDFFLGLAVDDE